MFYRAFKFNDGSIVEDAVSSICRAGVVIVVVMVVDKSRNDPSRLAQTFLIGAHYDLPTTFKCWWPLPLHRRLFWATCSLHRSGGGLEDRLFH